MPKTYGCPFWKWSDKLKLTCEGGRLDFPDDATRREYIDQFCASAYGWRGCTIAASMMDYYERKDENGEKCR